MANIINGTDTGSGGLITTGDSSDELQIQTAETTALTITSGQQSVFIAGTAAAPAVTTTGDLNTGIFFSAADTLVVTTGGTAAVTVDSGQRTKFPTTIGVGDATPSASGSGISFPATQSASSDANTLDDYEEGTWTPTLIRLFGPSAYTFTNQTGNYTKIGRIVQVQFQMTISAITTQGTRFLRITGLPFTSQGGTNNYGGGSVTVQDCISGEPCSSIGVQFNDTVINLYGISDPTNNQGLLGETGAASVTVIAGTLSGSITYSV
jgi:hypothetical protein